MIIGAIVLVDDFDGHDPWTQKNWAQLIVGCMLVLAGVIMHVCDRDMD